MLRELSLLLIGSVLGVVTSLSGQVLDKNASPSGEFINIDVRRVLPDVPFPNRVRYSKHHFFVMSRGDNSILELDGSLQTVRRIGRIGSGPGELYLPDDFDVAEDGSIWVADRGNRRVQGFKSGGEAIGSFPVTTPTSIAALGNDKLVVVDLFDVPLAHVFKRDGTQSSVIEGQTPLAGATDKQNNYFNKSRLTALPDGNLLLCFHFLIPPLARVYAPDNRVLAKFEPAGIDMAGPVDTLRTRRVEDLKSSTLGGRVAMTGCTFERETGDIWVAPAAPGFYRFSKEGKQLRQYRLKGDDGQLHAVSDLVFGDDSVLFVSGPFLMLGKRPK
jgi:hypothetical protein